MGSLTRFRLQEIIDRYNCNILIETGTGAGDSLDYCSRFNFTKLYSIEIHEEIYKSARDKFAHDDRIEILNSSSADALKEIIPALGQDDTVLFWLDAHFPGADYGLAKPGDEKNDDIRLPLEQELHLISSLRTPRDVILVDDLRIYEEGFFEMGNLPDSWSTMKKCERNIKFVYKYLILLPRDVDA
jgi:hypothetical protein